MKRPVNFGAYKSSLDPLRCTQPTRDTQNIKIYALNKFLKVSMLCLVSNQSKFHQQQLHSNLNKKNFNFCYTLFKWQIKNPSDFIILSHF